VALEVTEEFFGHSSDVSCKLSLLSSLIFLLVVLIAGRLCRLSTCLSTSFLELLVTLRVLRALNL